MEIIGLKSGSPLKFKRKGLINMSSHAQQAKTLVEALPYIQKFTGKTIVVKYGGNAMISEELRRAVMCDIILLSLVGIRVVVVHGGGPEISEMLKRVGHETHFVDGLRYTDETTMDIVQSVLCGKVNKNLVAMVQELGVPAAGISGKDGGLLQVEKKYSDGKDIGFVGDVTKVNPKILYDLIDCDYLPIVAPVGMDENCETYNINADDAACAIARAVGADKLVFLTDVEGLYKDFSDKSSFISRITASDAEALVSSGEIGGGMLPKLNNCTAAVKGGVNRVHILDGRIPHCLLLEIFTDHGIGTAIVGDDEQV